MGEFRRSAGRRDCGKTEEAQTRRADHRDGNQNLVRRPRPVAQTSDERPIAQRQSDRRPPLGRRDLSLRKNVPLLRRKFQRLIEQGIDFGGLFGGGHRAIPRLCQPDGGPNSLCGDGSDGWRKHEIRRCIP